MCLPEWFMDFAVAIWGPLMCVHCSGNNFAFEFTCALIDVWISGGPRMACLGAYDLHLDQ